MVAAKVAGLDPDVWWEAMKGGAADSFVMQHDVPSILAGHYDPSFRLALCTKDLGLIDEQQLAAMVEEQATRGGELLGKVEMNAPVRLGPVIANGTIYVLTDTGRLVVLR